MTLRYEVMHIAILSISIGEEKPICIANAFTAIDAEKSRMAKPGLEHIVKNNNNINSLVWKDTEFAMINDLNGWKEHSK